MINNKKITLIIPCKNEEAALCTMLQKVPSYIDEIIVVDNDSKDNTAAVAKKSGAMVFKEKRHIGGIGYGYAHQTGMKHATGDIIIALDGDNTYPIKAIKEVVEYMGKSQSDFVSCSRFPLADAHAISWIRQLGIKLLNAQVTILYGYPVKDILTGMWAMKKDVVKKLNASNGEWNFSPEIKLAALTNPDIKFAEYHIAHSIRRNGYSKQDIWKTGFSHLLYIIKFRLSLDKASKRHVDFIANNIRYVVKSLAALIFLKTQTKL